MVEYDGAETEAMGLAGSAGNRCTSSADKVGKGNRHQIPLAEGQCPQFGGLRRR